MGLFKSDKNSNEGNDSTNRLYSLLAKADETYSRLPLNMRVALDKISRGLSEFGPRKLGKRGLGTEFYEARAYRENIDDPRSINARLSARHDKDIVVDKEAEIRQHFYLWRDGSESMDYKSDSEDVPFTKKESSEIMMMAIARHLVKNEDLIGVIGGKGVYRGGRASSWVAGQMKTLSIIADDTPKINRPLPRNSTVILFSDFLTDPHELNETLRHIRGVGLQGHLVMVLDPQEIDFDYEGIIEFTGMEGEGSKILEKAESVREEYRKKMQKQIDTVAKVAASHNFKFILQRTDRPLHQGIFQIYGLGKPGGPSAGRSGPQAAAP